MIIADHAAKTGAGISVTATPHRIEEAEARREAEAAGFRLVEEGKFLRNPDDPRVENVFRTKVPVDNFVMKFIKP